MNIAANPWSFTSVDVSSVAQTSMALNSDKTTVSLTTAALPATFVANAFVTSINNTNPLYNGWYRILYTTGGTVAVLQQLGATPVPAGTAPSAGGVMLLNQVQSNVRAEDITWQSVTSAGQLLDIRDRNGNLVWQAEAVTTGSQNRGKPYWLYGISLYLLQSGIVMFTVN